MANGWRALHQLGVDSILRQTAYPIVGSVYPIHARHLYTVCICISPKLTRHDNSGSPGVTILGVGACSCQFSVILR